MTRHETPIITERKAYNGYGIWLWLWYMVIKISGLTCVFNKFQSTNEGLSVSNYIDFK